MYQNFLESKLKRGPELRNVSTIGSYGDISLLRVSVQGVYNDFLVALLLGVNHFTDCCALTTTVLNCRVPRSFIAVVGTSTCFILSNYCL